MNKPGEQLEQQKRISEQLHLDKFHIPKNVIPNSGYGTVTLTYKDYEIVDVRTSITHKIERSNKKKFS